MEALKERVTVECFGEKLFQEIVTSEFRETRFQMQCLKYEAHICTGCFPDPVYSLISENSGACGPLTMIGHSYSSC